MYGDDPENVFYYLTIYNEPYAQPAEPDGLDVDGMLRGHVPVLPRRRRRRAARPAAGVGRRRARGRCAAQELLRDDWGVAADVWSVTSLERAAPRRRRGRRAEPAPPGRADRGRRTSPTSCARPARSSPSRTSCAPCRTRSGRWVPGGYSSLGTDGWGMSDTRGALRRHFKVDAESIAVRTLEALERRGEVPAGSAAQAIEKYQLGDPAAADAGSRRARVTPSVALLSSREPVSWAGTTRPVRRWVRGSS